MAKVSALPHYNQSCWPYLICEGDKRGWKPPASSLKEFTIVSSYAVRNNAGIMELHVFARSAKKSRYAKPKKAKLLWNVAWRSSSSNLLAYLNATRPPDAVTDWAVTDQPYIAKMWVLKPWRVNSLVWGRLASDFDKTTAQVVIIKQVEFDAELRLDLACDPERPLTSGTSGFVLCGVFCEKFNGDTPVRPVLLTMQG